MAPAVLFNVGDPIPIATLPPLFIVVYVPSGCFIPAFPPISKAPSSQTLPAPIPSFLPILNATFAVPTDIIRETLLPKLSVLVSLNCCVTKSDTPVRFLLPLVDVVLAWKVDHELAVDCFVSILVVTELPVI